MQVTYVFNYDKSRSTQISYNNFQSCFCKKMEFFDTFCQSWKRSFKYFSNIKCSNLKTLIASIFTLSKNMKILMKLHILVLGFRQWGSQPNSENWQSGVFTSTFDHWMGYSSEIMKKFTNRCQLIKQIAILQIMWHFLRKIF